jgi:hypothetical protein
LSLKALRPGVSANLTVVINEKVYCFFCEQDNDPCFVMIFGAPGEKAVAPEGAEARSAPAEKKEVSRDQLVGFLGKLKDYSNLKVGSPDSISALDVAEPNKKSGTGEIETLIKRIVRDDALGLVGFEIELSNRSQSDRYLDPERFAVRVGDATYEESISDSGGIVPAGTSVPAFFVVTDGGGSDLSVDQNFEVEIRTADHAQNPRVTQNFVEPPQNYLPTPTARDPGNGVKSGSSGKAESKGGKETAGKPKHTLEVASAKDHGTKTPVPSTKKHWWDLFKRNSVTSE